MEIGHIWSGFPSVRPGYSLAENPLVQQARHFNEVR